MLEVKDLSCGYGDKAILKNINFTLSLGEILCIIGANGVSKTTTFKTILGLIKPLSGEFLVGEDKFLNLSLKDRAKLISYTAQSHIHHLHLAS
ncbi:MAG: ABC transporter ATP-binding protein [Campylobacter sp.]|nr:ABC transporter ATP-binding protein [Campylobacter sp.]